MYKLIYFFFIFCFSTISHFTSAQNVYYWSGGHKIEISEDLSSIILIMKSSVFATDIKKVLENNVLIKSTKQFSDQKSMLINFKEE